MNIENDYFDKYTDELGELYYCPINTVADEKIVSQREIDNCVEASTVGRYAGNINLRQR